jgi:hypothetical protein
MASTPRQLWLAQQEVQKAAHDQDLIEVPRRAQLDRATEYQSTYDEIQSGVKSTELASF